MTRQSPQLDDINRRTYARGRVVAGYARLSGWLDPGEEAAIGRARDAARGQPILDIGFGGGRTVPLMLEISRDYVGVDYTPRMVAAARGRFPGVDLREGDARRLDFPDRRFGLVAFSFNGIDSVDFAGRLQVLREVRRVLRPGGFFVFSSLNRHGPVFRAGVEAPSSPEGLLGYAPRRGPVAAAAVLVALWNRRRLQKAQWADGERALVNMPSHARGLVAAFTSLAEQRRELEGAGFRPEAVFHGLSGQPVEAGGDGRHEDAPCFYHVARRPDDAS